MMEQLTDATDGGRFGVELWCCHLAGVSAISLMLNDKPRC